MPTLYLIPYRKGERIGDDVYVLLLDGDKVRHIYPEKLKEWMVEIHCGHTGMKCVHCQKYIHNNVKFANVLLYFVYDAETNILSHKTNYLPFTGLSYRYSDDEELIVLDGHFKLALREGMFLSFNLPPIPATSKPMRFGCSMDFYVGAFEEEEEEAAIDADVDIEVDDDDDEEEDDDDMVDDDDEDEEDTNINRSVVLLSDNDDDDDQPPQLIDHNAEEKGESIASTSMTHIERLVRLARSPHTSFEINNNMEVGDDGDDDDDDDRPPSLVSLYEDNQVVYLASDRGPQQTIPFITSVAVQPPLDPRPPPQIPEDARVPIISVGDNATPRRLPDPPGGTPLNFSSPLPTNASQPVSQRLCSHHMFNTFARSSEDDGGDADDIAAVLHAELEETQAKLQAALERNALLSPLEKGYQSLNSP